MRLTALIAGLVLASAAACGARSELDVPDDAADDVATSDAQSPDVADASSEPAVTCAPPTVPGASIWTAELGAAISFPPQAFYGVSGMAADAQGNLVVAGYFIGVLDFGDGFTLTSEPDVYPDEPSMNAAYSEDMFVVKLDPLGHPLFAKSFGGTGYQYARDVAVDAQGDVLVVGDFQYAIDFGGPSGAHATGAPYSGIKPNPYNAFVVSLDAQGNTQWSATYGDATVGAISGAIAVDASGDVTFGGYFGGTIELAPNQTTNALGVFDPQEKAGSQFGGDAFLVKLTGAGAYAWSRSFGHAGSSQIVEDLAIDPSGGVVLVGSFQNTLDLDLGNAAGLLVSSASCASGDFMYDGFVAKLDPNGSLVWSRALEGDDASFVTNVAVDGAGNIVLTGNFNGDLALVGDAGVVATDAATMPPNEEAGVGCVAALESKPWNTFVAKLDASGALGWAYAIGESSPIGAEDSNPVAVDDAGAIFVSGALHNGGVFPSVDGGVFAIAGVTGYYSGWVAQLDTQGRAVWAQSFGEPSSSSWPQDLALGPCQSEVYVGGIFAGAMTLPSSDGGAGPILDSGNATNTNIVTWQMFLARLSR